MPMSLPARLAYISGFFYYAYTALLTFFGPVIPIVMLAFLPGHIRLRNFVVLLPAMLTGFVLYPLWHRSRYGPGVWPLGIARGWAHVFAIWDGARGKSMSWHPTRTPGSSLRRFRVGVTVVERRRGRAVAGAGRLADGGAGVARSSPSCCSSACSTSPSWAASSSREAGQHEIPRLVMLLAVAARRGRRRLTRPAAWSARLPPARRRRTPSLAPDLASYLGVFEAGAPPDYGADRRASRRRRAGSRTCVGYYSGWAQPFDTSFAETLRAHGVIPFVQIDPTDASVAGDRGRHLRRLPALLRRQRARLRPRRGHRLRARDERSLVLVGLRARPGGDVRGRLAAHRDAVPQRGRRQRHLAVDAPGGRARHRADRLLVARRAVRHLGRHRRLLLPPSDTFASVFGQTISQVRAFTSKPVLLSETAVGPEAGQFAKIQDLFHGMAKYKTLGLVWFDKAQHGGIYHQDWRIEDNPQAEISFRLGVRDGTGAIPSRWLGAASTEHGQTPSSDIFRVLALRLSSARIAFVGRKFAKRRRRSGCAGNFRKRRSCPGSIGTARDAVVHCSGSWGAAQILGTVIAG